MQPTLRKEISRLIRNIIAPGGRAFLPTELTHAIQEVAAQSVIPVNGHREQLGEFWSHDTEDPNRADKIDFLKGIGKRLYHDFAKNTSTLYEDPSVSLFYTLYYLPRNFHKIQLALLQLFEQDQLPHVIRALDVGCGVGTVSLALTDFILLLENICQLVGKDGPSYSATIDCLDSSASNLVYLQSLHDKLSLSKASVEVRTIQTIVEPSGPWLELIPNGVEYNLLFFSNFLTELTARGIDPNGRAQIVEAAAGKLVEDGYVIIIEPADELNSKEFHAVQSCLLKSGINNWFPCRHLNESQENHFCSNCWAFRSEKLRQPEFLIPLAWKDKTDAEEEIQWVYGLFSRKPKPRAQELTSFTNLGMVGNRVNVRVQINSPLLGKGFHKVCGEDGRSDRVVLHVDEHQAIPVVTYGEILELKHVKISKNSSGFLPGDFELYYDAQSEAHLADCTNDQAGTDKPTRLIFKDSARQRETLRYFLQRLFGFEDFRPGQIEVINQVLAGQDVLAVMATSAGKSLCFQLPAMLLPGVAIVVAPLLSLVQDQLFNLHQLGIDVVERLNSEQPNKEKVLERMTQGYYKIVYMTPEQLMNERVILKLQQTAYNQGISLFAVDEVHCLSQWGHDFRPAYLNLRRHFDAIDAICPERTHTPTLALTATASDYVIEDVLSSLKIPDDHLQRHSFDRPELSFEVIKVPLSIDKGGGLRYKKLLEVLSQKLKKVLSSGIKPGIIFVPYRGENLFPNSDWWLFSAEGLSRQLDADFGNDGWRVSCYHSALDLSEREKRQVAFKEGNIDILVATKGFGMGIDKGNIRFVIHFSMPESLESYYQQAGRSGRDNCHSHCILLYGEPNGNQGNSLFSRPEPTEEFFDNYCTEVAEDPDILTDYDRQMYFIDENYPKDRDDITQAWNYLRNGSEPSRSPEGENLYIPWDNLIIAVGWMTAEQIIRAAEEDEYRHNRDALLREWNGFVKATKNHISGVAGLSSPVSCITRLPDGTVDQKDWDVLLGDIYPKTVRPSIQSRIGNHPIGRKVHALAEKKRRKPDRNILKEKSRADKKLRVNLDVLRRMRFLYTWDIVQTRAEYIRRLSWEEIEEQTRDPLVKGYISSLRLGLSGEACKILPTRAFREVDLIKLSFDCGLDVVQIHNVFDYLNKFHFIQSLKYNEWQVIIRFEELVLTLSDADQESRLAAAIEQLYLRREREVDMLNSMQRYIDTNSCRRQSIVGYFLQQAQNRLIVRCNFCDTCCPNGIQGERAQVEEATRRQVIVVEDLRSWLEKDISSSEENVDGEIPLSLKFVADLRPYGNETPIWDLVQGVCAFHLENRFSASWRAMFMMLWVAGERRDRSGVSHWITRLKECLAGRWTALYSIGETIYDRYQNKDETIITLLSEAAQKINLPSATQLTWLKKLIDLNYEASAENLDRMASLERELELEGYKDHYQDAIKIWIRTRRVDVAANRIRCLIDESVDFLPKVADWIELIISEQPQLALDLINYLAASTRPDAINLSGRLLRNLLEFELHKTNGNFLQENKSTLTNDIWSEVLINAANTANQIGMIELEIRAWERLLETSDNMAFQTFQAHSALAEIFRRDGSHHDLVASQYHLLAAARSAPDEILSLKKYHTLLPDWDDARIAEELSLLESQGKDSWCLTLLLAWYTSFSDLESLYLCNILLTDQRYQRWDPTSIKAILDTLTVDTLGTYPQLMRWWLLNKKSPYQNSYVSEKYSCLSLKLLAFEDGIPESIIKMLGKILFESDNESWQEQVRQDCQLNSDFLEKFYFLLVQYYSPGSLNAFQKWFEWFPVELILEDRSIAKDLLETISKYYFVHKELNEKPSFLSHLEVVFRFLLQFEEITSVFEAWLTLCANWPSDFITGVEICLSHLPEYQDCLTILLEQIQLVPTSTGIVLVSKSPEWAQTLASNQPDQAISLIDTFIDLSKDSSRKRLIEILTYLVDHEALSLDLIPDAAAIASRIGEAVIEAKCWRIIITHSEDSQVVNEKLGYRAATSLARLHQPNSTLADQSACRNYFRQAMKYLSNWSDKVALFDQILLPWISWNLLQEELHLLPQDVPDEQKQEIIYRWFYHHMNEPEILACILENNAQKSWLYRLIQKFSLTLPETLLEAEDKIIRHVHKVKQKETDWRQRLTVCGILAETMFEEGNFPQQLLSEFRTLYLEQLGLREVKMLHQVNFPHPAKVVKIMEMILEPTSILPCQVVSAWLSIYSPDSLISEDPILSEWIVRGMARHIEEVDKYTATTKQEIREAASRLFEHMASEPSSLKTIFKDWQIISRKWSELQVPIKNLLFTLDQIHPSDRESFFDLLLLQNDPQKLRQFLESLRITGSESKSKRLRNILEFVNLVDQLVQDCDIAYSKVEAYHLAKIFAIFKPNKITYRADMAFALIKALRKPLNPFWKTPAAFMVEALVYAGRYDDARKLAQEEGIRVGKEQLPINEFILKVKRTEPPEFDFRSDYEAVFQALISDWGFSRVH